SFKPFIYSAALDSGYTAASLVNDAPIVFVDDYLDQVWRPKNDNNTFLGPIRLREALYKSRNLVSIRLLQAVGIEYALNYVSRFGFTKQDLPRNLSLALGTANLTPLEVASGWTAFANGGYKIQPYLIERIDDRHGEPLFFASPATVPGSTDASTPQAGETELAPIAGSPASPPAPSSTPPAAERIIDERTAYIMTSMLQDVIKRGTGRRAMALGRNDLAGKTGTTNESKDSWFSGYNADYVTT
ncbi:peptidase, partial [Pseudomonas sp. CrR25]|nr:peptidase [Pseudomonas sp. CrR25]